MSLWTWIGVGVLGAVGAWLRFRLVAFVQMRRDSDLPIGTLVVNLLGTFLLGLLSGASVGGRELVLVGAGLLGSFTTFSTVMLESAWLESEGRRRTAIVNVALSLGGGLAVAACGFWLGRYVN